MFFLFLKARTVRKSRRCFCIFPGRPDSSRMRKQILSWKDPLAAISAQARSSWSLKRRRRERLLYHGEGTTFRVQHERIDRSRRVIYYASYYSNFFGHITSNVPFKIAPFTSSLRLLRIIFSPAGGTFAASFLLPIQCIENFRIFFIPQHFTYSLYAFSVAMSVRVPGWVIPFAPSVARFRICVRGLVLVGASTCPFLDVSGLEVSVCVYHTGGICRCALQKCGEAVRYGGRTWSGAMRFSRNSPASLPSPT